MSDLALTPDAELLLDSPLTSSEQSELADAELRIKLAGKDRLDKMLLIGAELSHIYNNALFRGAGGVTFGQYVEQRMPQLLPDEPVSLTTAHRWRWLYEVRTLLSAERSSTCGGSLPTTPTVAEVLVAAIPRRVSKLGASGSWTPSVLDEPAEGLQKIWELACKTAQQQERRNGPTVADVQAARLELTPVLVERGQLRQAPPQFQRTTEERRESATRQHRTVNVEALDAERQRVRDEAPARQQAAQRQALRDEIERPEREAQQELERNIRAYNKALMNVDAATAELLSFLRAIDAVKGTQYLDEMRAGDVVGLITVRDDLTRLQTAGQALMQAVRLAQSSGPPTGITVETIDV